MRLKRPPYKELPNKSKSGRGPINLEGQYRVRKRGTLEDSSLGLKGINIYHMLIQVSQLVEEAILSLILYFVIDIKF